MPLSSLRRRAVNEPLPPKEERSSPSPYSAQSTTTVGLTPRKSLQSLIGSVRKRGTTAVAVGAGGGAHVEATVGRSVTPSPRQSILEQTLYSSHDRSKIGQAADRTPSPHPAKVSASSSKSRIFKFESPRTFLETLADAIRAPASLFYKEKRQKSGDGSLTADEVDATTQVDSKVDNYVNSNSPTKSSSSKKSVRFKPGNSIIKDEQRSSPIDIPKPAPFLPPMHLATTPLLQCFGRDMTDPIPTGRPRDPPVLRSTLTFRQAMAEAQECLAKDGLPDFTPLGSVVSDDATSPLAMRTRLEDRVGDPKGVFQGSNDVYPSREAVLCTAVHEQQLVENGKTQDLPDISSNDTRLATASPYSLSESDRHTPNPGTLTEHLNGSLSALPPNIQMNPSDIAPNVGSSLFSVHHHDVNPEDKCEKPACPRHSSPKRRQIDKKWLGKPTLEDIRGRFKYPERYDTSSSEQLDPFSDENGYSNATVCAKVTVAPSPDTVAEMGPIQLPSLAPDQQSEAFPPRIRKYLRSSSEGNPISPTSFLRNPPWSSELALRCGKSSSAEHLNTIMPYRLQEKLSSFAETESDLEGGAGLPVRKPEDSTEDLLIGFKTAHQPFPGRAISREIQTPSPALIPLPLSCHVPASSSTEFETEEYDLRPFDGESHGNDFLLPPGYDPRKYSSEFWRKECTPSPFDEAVSLSKYDEKFSSSNPESKIQRHANDRDTPKKIPRVTSDEQLAKAAAVLKRFEPRKGSGSSKPDNSSSAQPSVAARPLNPFNAPRSGWSVEPTHSLSNPVTEPADTPTRSRATTVTSSNCPTVYSGKSRNSVSTNTTKGMEEDEAMCKGLI